MEIDTLPITVLLKIFQYLPLKDLVRTIGVNRLFSETSQLVLTNYRELDLNEDLFRKIDTDQFDNFLRFLPNLRRITFVKGKIRGHHQAFVRVVADFLISIDSSRLTELDLIDYRIRQEIATKLIVACPNLETLKISQYNAVPCCPNVEFLQLKTSNDDQLRFLHGRFPKLKQFTTELHVTPERLDEFFANFPSLERLNFTMAWPVFFEDLRYFFNLPLKSFIVKRIGLVPDHVFLKKFERFRAMEEIDFEVMANERAMASVASLKNLRSLTLEEMYYSGNVMGVELFWKLGELRRLKMARSILSPRDVVGLIRFCPDLCEFGLARIEGIDTSTGAIAFLKSLIDFGDCRKLTFTFYQKVPKIFYKFQLIWESDEVRKVVEEIRDVGGPSIRVEVLRSKC